MASNRRATKTSRRPRPVILAEFNELSPVLMERFMSEGHLPNFQRMYGEAHAFVTDAGEQPPNLEPWIQWVTVHSGLPLREHGVFRLGDGHHLQVPQVWDVFSANQLPVWVCGSMNARCEQPLQGTLLPDPWSAAPPHPDELLPYHRFVLKHVQEHTNDHVPLGPADYLRFLRFMVTHGLSVGTVAATALQILSERLRNRRWRRPLVMDWLQFDLFAWHYRRHRPAFSTFFLNSTAHFQHNHWRDMEPDLFKVKPAPEEQKAHERAILAGYQNMDDLLGRILDLAGSEATVILCTGLSQQPCLQYEDQGGKVAYRPRDFEALLAFAGVTSPHRVAPVMTEEFHVVFEDAKASVEAYGKLMALEVAGAPAMKVDLRDDGVFVGCALHTDAPADAELRAADGRTCAFFDLFYRMAWKSGMHHPDGMLWIRTQEKQHSVRSGKVSLTQIAPTILAMSGLSRPRHMKGEPLTLGLEDASDPRTRLAPPPAHLGRPPDAPTALPHPPAADDFSGMGGLAMEDEG
jgi:hypothetical protein